MADKLTPAQMRALRYLEDKICADDRNIGVAILGERYKAQIGSCIKSGAAVMSTLRRKGLVLYLPGEIAWRISAAGQAALSEAEIRDAR